jgi:type VI secretion system secreted protein VgrG
MFHWDRDAEADEKSSCWIRVSQSWAGKNWGSIQIPRIGQEVLVDFIHGDPDRPIVIGSVYNGSAMPPYDLPANATMSGVKSRSSKGGDGFNEIRFEDKKDEEQIFIHGQKNQDINIKNDCFETIGNDKHLVVENNRNEEVKADHVEKIGKDRQLSITGKEVKEVTGDLALTVDGDVAEVFNKNHSMQVTDDSNINGTNIYIEATTKIVLKVGSSSISIEKGGIIIKTGSDIELDAGAKIEIKSGADTKIDAGTNAKIKSSANTEIEAGANASIKGAMVKIN